MCFDRFEEASAAAATVRSKRCAKIFLPGLAPSFLLRSQWYLQTRTLGGPGVQCKILAKLLKIMWISGHLSKKISHFRTFLPIFLVIPTELGRRHCYGQGAHCPGILPQTTLTLGNGSHFKSQKLHFCTFSGQVSPEIARNYFLWFLVNFSDSLIFFCNF